MSDSEQPTAGGAAEASAGASQEADVSMDYLKQLFARLTASAPPEGGEEAEAPEQLLPAVSFQGVADYIQSDRSAGIPDFRSPGTGLYDNLQKYDLPNPQAIFEINFFKTNPKPFYELAKELYPGKFKPTYSHYFIKLLEDKGLLARAYTQNIDTLERVAGVSGDKIVEAHGAFHLAHCVECKQEYSQQWIKEKVFNDEIPHCTECDGLVKPDIVFFGEPLPQRFFQLRATDFESCDLLIVMGTSLKVQPFASLVGAVNETTPRLLINREKCGAPDPMMLLMGMGSSGMDFDSEKAYRDVAWLGNCDDGCRALCVLLGWSEELETMVEKEHSRIDKEHDEEAKKPPKQSEATQSSKEKES